MQLRRRLITASLIAASAVGIQIARGRRQAPAGDEREQELQARRERMEQARAELLRR